MRIIAGKARGVRLLPPAGEAIRPTLDRVRESFFNIVAGYVPEGRFLDLFAGTGANGLEALSRGAAEVTFVDSSSSALTLVRDNLRRTRLEGRVMCLQLDLPEGLARIPGSYDVVYADPPYHFGGHEGLLSGLAAGALLAAEAIVAIEHERRTALPPEVSGLSRYRESRYGDVMISFYSR